MAFEARESGASLLETVHEGAPVRGAGNCATSLHRPAVARGPRLNGLAADRGNYLARSKSIAL
ncbi:hypothetical protein GCM10009540_53030 [Streptomyces turgidiscabies]|nr:hypothetical protein T45_01696 [Streptomyces turgidiscabies]